MEDIAWGSETHLSDFQFYNCVNEREYLIDLLNGTRNNLGPSILISGKRGVGKTCLVNKVLEEFEDFDIIYTDFTCSNDYQNGKLTEQAIDELVKSNETFTDGSIGKIYIVDNFQLIKDMKDYKGFLKKVKGNIKTENNIAYIFIITTLDNDDFIDDINGIYNGIFEGKLYHLHLKEFNIHQTKDYLSLKLPELSFKDSFDEFYNYTLGLPLYINTFAKLLPKNVDITTDRLDEEFKKALPLLASTLISKWSSLTLQEKKILTELTTPKKRVEIANALNVTSGSLGTPLNNLKSKQLITQENNKYMVSEPILIAWLINEYNKKGVCPFRR